MATQLLTPHRSTPRRPRIGFVNLGCSKNQVDSEVMLGVLAAAGFELTADSRDADAIIINTCGFIEEAKQESINSIIEHGRLKKRGSCRVLIAAGCLAQRYQGELLAELPELDAVVGTGEFGRIAEITRSLLGALQPKQQRFISPPPYLYDELAPRVRLGASHSAYVKIAEGCNRACSFCAIPIMRGKQRSRPIDSIVAEVTRLVEEGVKEINLISQDTINYGVDLGLRHGLTSLLRQLVKIKDLRWIRPFYLYPQQLTDELLDLYAGEATITKYIDMPLQHINDDMLKRMRRIGDRSSLIALVDRIRHRIPGVSFRTAFIVGYPGETDQAFEELRSFVAESGFERVAVFLYSDEEDTAAMAHDGKIPRRVMEERRNELLLLQDEIAAAKSRGRIGHMLEVFIDGRSEGGQDLLEARHEGLAPEIDGVVLLPKEAGLPGQFVKAVVTDAVGYDLIATATDRRRSPSAPLLPLSSKMHQGYR